MKKIVFSQLGGKPLGSKELAPYHTPIFFIDECRLLPGAKTRSQLVVNYLNQ